MRKSLGCTSKDGYRLLDLAKDLQELARSRR
jgi:hypothetical protein